MKALLLAMLLVAALVTYAGADPITMTFSDPGGGDTAGSGNTVSIGGRTVTNAPFTITAVSDTSTRITNPGPGAATGFSLINISASITVAELGTFDFITPTRVNLIASPNVVGGTVFFTRANSLGFVSPGDIYGGITTLALQTWDMLSSIGPQSDIAVTRYIDSTSPAPIVTSGGVLVFNSPQNPATFNLAQFQANVGSGGGGPVASTAEPGTLAFVGGGLILLVTSAVRPRRP